MPDSRAASPPSSQAIQLGEDMKPPTAKKTPGGHITWGVL